MAQYAYRSAGSAAPPKSKRCNLSVSQLPFSQYERPGLKAGAFFVVG
jgi:hypothetical protein